MPTIPKDHKQVGRLALRQEGGNWVAYYALQGTMQNALFLGSIRMTSAQNPKRKAAFMALMREIVGDLIEDATGIRPVWGGPTTAPEHERSKNA
jgi:hypothetical protein